MIIIADKEGKEYIEGLCNLALIGGGIQNLDTVNKVINSMKDIKDDTKKPDKEVEKPKTNKIPETTGDKKDG